MANILDKIFGTKHQRDTKKIEPVVEEINQIYEEYHKLSDEQLRAKTEEFKQRIKEGLENAGVDELERVPVENRLVSPDHIPEGGLRMSCSPH